MTGQTTLRGRAPECAALDRLLDAVRGGESRTLVLRGEPGVGKTALVDYVIGSAPDLRVLRAVGVESEMELAFASLQRCARRRSIGSSASPARSRMRLATSDWRLGRCERIPAAGLLLP